MKKRLFSLILVTVMIFSFYACSKNNSGKETAETDKKETVSYSPTSLSNSASLETARLWIEEKIENDSLFSFEYGSLSYSEVISGAEKKTDKQQDESGNTVYTVEYLFDGVTVSCTALLYKDTAAVDWVCSFKNSGNSDSQPISNIQIINSTVAVNEAEVNYAYGSNGTSEDFSLLSQKLSKNPELKLSSSGGRSSQNHMPYFDIINDKGGVLAAVGWTGQWSASVKTEGDEVRIRAGMTNTDIALHPGESMRTPSFVLTFFSGDADTGHNVFRQLILNEYTPVDKNGNTVTSLPLTINAWGSSGVQKLLSEINTAKDFDVKFDVLWVDAGWYGSRASADTYDDAWSQQVGDWYYNEKLYPNGFSEISELLHQDNKGLLLWFEPERVRKDTELYRQHREYILESPATGDTCLWNFADDEAADYMIALISTFIKNNGLDWYRQDFNCDPLVLWQIEDDKQGFHREGITEIKYITNLYRYLDTLSEQNPGLLIDNCASGGKRLDIEMMKRSVPLWRSDYYVSGSATDSDSARSLGYNLSYWLPLSCGGSTWDGLNTAYDFRSAMGSGMTVAIPTSNFNWWNQRVEEYYRIRELMTGDYYILSQGNLTNFTRKNACYEYCKPDTGEGCLILFRPEDSLAASQTYFLKGLDTNASYSLIVSDNGEKITATGKELMENGLTVSMKQPRMSLVIYFTKN